MLSVSDVTFTYGGRNVLSGVDFKLAAGELLAILGPNGVGKTTLLKCINAIHKPSSGTITVEGQNVLKMSPARIARTIGYVAQRCESARLTVFDAVLMGRRPHIRWRVSEKDMQMVDAAIKRLDMQKLSLRYIDELSGGELQKVSIARALVQEPKLLLLDEPTSSLDLKSQIDIMTMLRRVVVEHKIGAVMTMHDVNMALRYADNVLFLKDGRIHATGPTSGVTSDVVEEVYGLPVNIHTVQGHPMIVPAQ